ncbi:hypothetical protein J7E38_18550 [Bacillus sp. ISL-35]|uniref:hypothetical protein n=1 Tax=Bacillus sp. ISL-35 TaxID=2819122 RepID=UPI001BE7AE00|nr:hypothetical protein [Bacillus sp. ISL-35]MBT2680994.1 hypothetical protein [Bacillus sp. ISL-35]MBT2705313.1 hypothetical protein [Chryseobacterium sp. ISL-80]
MNATALVMNLVSWVLILFIALRIYRKQEIKPRLWKMAVVIFIGLFSFSINLPYMNQPIKVAVLPLGAWILYALYHKRNEGTGWDRYRKYACLGFLANYIFLLSALLSPLIQSSIYPKGELTTYISDTSGAHILKTHPSGIDKVLDAESLRSEISNMELRQISSDAWYYDSVQNVEHLAQADERFPYQMTGVKPRMGSGFHPVIFVEEDGKGILISTVQEQFYFRSQKPFLKEGE